MAFPSEKFPSQWWEAGGGGAPSPEAALSVVGKQGLQRRGRGSAKPFLNASDPSGQLHVLREESDPAGV